MSLQPTILSGASRGFDTIVAHLCVKYGHKHLICIPPCDPQVKQFVPLTQAQLNVGSAAVQRAGVALGRTVSKPQTLAYLQRNAHLASHAHQLLAFGHFDDNRKHVEGGVGWTVEMAKQRDILVFVFDLDYEEWWYWSSHWNAFLQCEGMSDEWIANPSLTDMTTLMSCEDFSPAALPHLEKLFQTRSSCVVTYH